MSDTKICPQCGLEFPVEQRFCPTDGAPLRVKGGTNDLTGSVIADRFLILKTLGEGGMGRVYLAEHVRMGRKCALKVMSQRMANDPDAISRFNREAANACKINHPHVAAVYDFGETADGVIYLAMEFVEGAPLTTIVEQHGALPPGRAAEIARQTADALAAAHELGIVHRDLKPDNIMIARNRDGSDCVKVVDFGIAKVADNDAQKVTKTGLVVGTPDYMSPEQLAADKIDGRSDVYSLGLVTFNMLTGKLPFPANSQQEAMIMRLTDRPKRLDEMAPQVSWPAAVQTVLDRALERDADLRYRTAKEFGREIVAALGSGAAGLGASRPSDSGATAIIDPAQRPRPQAPTRISATEPAIPATLAANGRRKGFPVWMAAAGFLVVVGVSAALIWKNNDANASGDPGIAPSGAPAVTQHDTAQSDTVSMKNPIGGGSSGATSTSGPASSPGAGIASEAALVARLDAVNRLTRPSEENTDAARAADTKNARQALAILDTLRPQIRSDSSRAYFELLRGESFFLLDRIEEGCRLTRGIDEKLLSGTRRQRRETILKLLCST